MNLVNRVVDIELTEEECLILCRAVKLMEKMQQKLKDIDTNNYNEESKEDLETALNNMYSLCADYSCLSTLNLDDYEEVV